MYMYTHVSFSPGITINKVRLTGTTIDNAGIVEIYYSRLSRWVTVCHSTWSSTDANTLCTSLGYASGMPTPYNTAALLVTTTCV